MVLSWLVLHADAAVNTQATKNHVDVLLRIMTPPVPVLCT